MVRTEPKVPPNPPARGDDAPTYSSEYFRAMKAKVQNMSALELIQAVGVHQQLLDASWPKFLVLLLVYYLGSGGLFGALLFATRSRDHPEAEGLGLVTYWYHGFFLQLINVTFSPETDGQMVVTMLGCFVGSMVTLLLFGLVYEKFAERQPSVKFGRRVMLRRLPEAMGGYTMLTFRYANLQGVTLVCAQARCMIARRMAMPGGDSVIFQEPCTIRSFESVGAVIAPSFFLHHVIDERSPLFDATRPGRCNFERCMRIFVSVSGWDASHTQHAGGSNWGTADIVMDARFDMMQKASGRTGRAIDWKAFESCTPLEAEEARVGAPRNELGLPAS